VQRFNRVNIIVKRSIMHLICIIRHIIKRQLIMHRDYRTFVHRIRLRLFEKSPLYKYKILGYVNIRGNNENNFF
jgi:hypothetical protein